MNSALLQGIGTFIKEIGFPIFVAVYLLVQVVALAPKIDRMAESLKDIADAQKRIEWVLRQNSLKR